MGILDNYLAAASEDRENTLNEENLDLSEYEQDVQTELEKLRNDPNDMMNQFMQNYPQVSEQEMIEGKLVKDSPVTPVVRRVYCPECGKELTSKNPLMLNPFTGQRIAKHECSCGYKANLEYAYPRIVFVDENNEEVMAFSR